MSAPFYRLTLCGGQRRHVARICMQELSEWLQADALNFNAELLDYRFCWHGGYPTLFVEIRTEHGCKTFEDRLISWCEMALDRVLFHHPWDETSLIAESFDPDGLFNVLDVRLARREGLAESDLPAAFAAALCASVLAADLRTLVDIKRALLVLLRESLRYCTHAPALLRAPGPRFDSTEGDALAQQKQRLRAAGRLDARFASLDRELRERFEPVLNLLNRHLPTLSAQALSEQLPAIVNRFGFSLRETDYLLFLAARECTDVDTLCAGSATAASGSALTPEG